jgi:hypothetical protein
MASDLRWRMWVCSPSDIGWERDPQVTFGAGDELVIRVLQRVAPCVKTDRHRRRWAVVREISDDGAILVCPDNQIGWRAMTSVTGPGVELTHILGAHT